MCVFVFIYIFSDTKICACPVCCLLSRKFILLKIWDMEIHTNGCASSDPKSVVRDCGFTEWEKWEIV